MQPPDFILLPVVATRAFQYIHEASYGPAAYLLACCGAPYWTHNAFQILLLALLGSGSAPQDVIRLALATLAGTEAWPLVLSAPLLMNMQEGLALYILTAACLLSKHYMQFQYLPQWDVTFLLQCAFFCWLSISHEQDLPYPICNYVYLSRALFLSFLSLVVTLGLSVRVLQTQGAKEAIMCAGMLLASALTLSAPYTTSDDQAGGNLFAFTLDRLNQHKRLVAYEALLVPLSLYLGITKALYPHEDPCCDISTMAPAAKKPYVLGRKFFHLVTALVALPQAVGDPYFMCAAWAVFLLAYAYAEGFRVINFGGAAPVINDLILPLTDKRDREGLILTPFFLGLGTCVCLWMETYKTGEFSPYRASIGLVATCVADGVAGVVGTFSPRKWKLYGSGDNGKTVQGTVAFIVSYVLFSLAEIAALARWEAIAWQKVLPAVVGAAVVSGLVEGYTESIDNFFVALVAYLTHCAICNL